METTAFNLRKILAQMSPQQATEFLERLRTERELVKTKLRSQTQKNNPINPTQAHADSQLVWHYTTGTCFLKIIDTGFLLPTDAQIPKHEVPALWFSRNQVWEATSAKGFVGNDGKSRTLTKLETYVAGAGLVRFGYPAANLINWPELQRKARILQFRAYSLEKAAYQVGAKPSDWMASMSKIAIADLMIESLEDEMWVRVADPLNSSDRSTFQPFEREAA